MVDVTKMENVVAEDMLEANLLRSIIKRDFLLEHQQLCGKGIFELKSLNYSFVPFGQGRRYLITWFVAFD